MAARKLVLPDDFADPGLPKGTFSHSQYYEYKKCGKSYEFKYVMGKPSRKTASLARGVTIHSLVEHAIKEKIAGKLVGYADMRDMAQDLFSAEKDTVEDWEDEEADRVQNVIVDSYTAWHTYALPKLNPVAVELGFASRVAGVPMVGYIDLVDAVKIAPDEGSPERHVVVDLKTTTKSWSQDQVDKNTQLTLYSAVTGHSDVRIDQLVQLKKGTEYRPVSTVRTATDRAVLSEDLAETVDFIKRGVFPKTSIDHWACGPRCAYWSECRGKIG